MPRNREETGNAKGRLVSRIDWYCTVDLNGKKSCWIGMQNADTDCHVLQVWIYPRY